MPQLDGLRAVAVAFVMAFHFVPWVDRYAPLGTIGVRLFFVLSGFLITGILLSWRGRPLGLALQTFYARRALRIFPLFYFVLAAAAALNIGPVRDTFAWHATYLSNLYFYLRGDWHGSVSHLWSLAVEEQFYMVWPLLILCAPERWLRPMVTAMIVMAPVSRLLFPNPMDSVLPTSCLDSLGIGALLALNAPALNPAAPHKRVPYESGKKWVPNGMSLWAATLLVSATLGLRYAGLGGHYQVVGLDFGVSLLSAWLVGGAAVGFRGLAGRLLSSRPMIAVGRISYGLYVYHGFTPYLLGRYVPGFTAMDWPLRFALLTSATGLIAVISWRFFERPLLQLKSRVGQITRSTDQITSSRDRPIDRSITTSPNHEITKFIPSVSP
jgi:peptidoglycan/LPS O-acetylase OafA/YrhL